MDKKSLAFLGILFINSQNNQDYANTLLVQPLPLTKLEVQIPEIKPQDNLEQKVKLPQGERCVIDISNHFIPELFSLSRDAEQYFSTKGVLRDPFQRERFGIFSSFQHHQETVMHYANAIKLKGDQPQPLIENKSIVYTTPKTIQKISSLETQLQNHQLTQKQIQQLSQELETLKTQVETIKKVQLVLHWEGFYNEEITGVYNQVTTNAVIKYQRFQQKYLHYGGKTDGKINPAIIKLLNKDFKDQALEGLQRVLEERVFHAECNGRYPYVIEQKQLGQLVDSAAEQLNLQTPEGAQTFFSSEHKTTTVYLDIPEQYQQDSMKLDIEVEKWDSGRWERVRTRTKLILYASEDGQRVNLFETTAVVGGWGKLHGVKKFFKTPEGKFYLKSLIVLPHWNPPNWSKEKYGEPVTLPGPLNAFGMMATPLYFNAKPQTDPFRGWQEGDDGYRIHLTAWPSSVESGYGVSHGCIRLHPNMSRFFYLITRYTPHIMVLEKEEGEKDKIGRETLKFTERKGSYIPFEPEHYISVRTCKEKCK